MRLELLIDLKHPLCVPKTRPKAKNTPLYEVDELLALLISFTNKLTFLSLIQRVSHGSLTGPSILWHLFF